MKSEKSKMLGALLPSESCHNDFEALYLQYSNDKAHTFYVALCLALRLLQVFENFFFKQVCYPFCFEG